MMTHQELQKTNKNEGGKNDNLFSLFICTFLKSIVDYLI